MEKKILKMLIITKNKDEQNQIIKSILNILRNNKLFTLSTLDDKQPYSNTAFYVYDSNFNLYYWSDKDAIHSKNISKNKKVAINIFNSNQKFGSDLEGLQALGIAFKVNKKELLKAGFLYIKRYPGVIKYIKKITDFHNPKFESYIYKIELSKIKLFNEKLFGKEGFREIIIKR